MHLARRVRVFGSCLLVLSRCPTLLTRVDVTDIKYVINFDFPNNSEDYIHRIGRTARAENTGTAYTFFTSSNARQAKDLLEVLREAKQNINPRLYDMMEMSRGMQSRGETGKWALIIGVELRFA